MAIKRGIVTENLITLFERGSRADGNTSGEDVEALHQLWDAYQKYQPKVQVAEQYFLQPLYASWYKAICDGKLGEVENINISSLHGYHGASIIRSSLEQDLRTAGFTENVTGLM